LSRPSFPQCIGLAIELLIARSRSRNDAGADDIVDQDRNRLGRVRVVAHKVAHAVAQQRPGNRDFRIGR